MLTRTPASVLAGAVVTTMLFVLMEHLVREPDAIVVPPSTAFDPLPPSRTVEPPPPERRPPPPRRPDAPQRPDLPDAATLTTEDPIQRAEPRVVIPFSPERPTLRPEGDPRGDPRGRPDGDASDGCRVGAPPVRFRIAPEYPRTQRAAGIEGEVEVEYSVGADGRVGAARVVRASRPGAFDSATLRAVRRWTFQPQGPGCDPGAVTVREVVSFRLEGVEE